MAAVSPSPTPPKPRISQLRAVAAENACVNCGSNVVGDFCASCGQRTPTDDDYKMRTLARAVIGHLTNWDSRLWTTFKTLFFRPGELARDHFEGRRARHLDPFRIFVLANVFVWFVTPHSSMRGFSVKMALDRALAPLFWMRAMAWRARFSHITVEELTKRLDGLSSSENSVAVLCFVPLLALALWALVGGRRYRYVHHLVFTAQFYAIHLVCVILWLGFLYRPLFKVLPSAMHHWYLNPWVQHLAVAPALVPYLYFGLKRAYELTPSQSAWRAVALALFSCTLARAFFDITFVLVLIWA